MTEKVIVSLALLVVLLVIALVSCDATAQAAGIGDVPATAEYSLLSTCLIGLLILIVGLVVAIVLHMLGAFR